MLSTHEAEVWVLAAGLQTRYGGDVPKGPHVVDGAPILEQISRLARGRVRGIIINDSNLWRPEYVRQLEEWFDVVATIRTGLPIGRTMAAALNRARGSAILVSGDTYIPAIWGPHLLLNSVEYSHAVFDPWNWITVDYIKADEREMYEELFDTAEVGRVELLAGRIVHVVRLSGCRNVNAPSLSC